MTDESTYRWDPERSYQFYLSTLPDDAKARLAEPRDEDFKPAHGFGMPTCRLHARDPVTTLSPYLHCLVTYFGDDRNDLTKLATIYNVEKHFGWRGGGSGFGTADIKGRPRLQMDFGSRSGLPAIWSVGRFFVASPEMHALLREYDPSALDVVEIDVAFNDGVSLAGYVFLDVIAQRFAWDYARSEVDVYLSDGRRRLQLHFPRTLRTDIPDTVHLFRDTTNLEGLLVGRELAVQMERMSSAQLMFTDYQCEGGSNLRQHRIRKKRSRFETAKAAIQPDRKTLQKRLSSEIEPLVQNGDLIAAEKAVAEWLRALEPSPYHIACDLQITTLPAAVAAYFDDYARKAGSEHELAVVYCEMNGFTINPDLWFCDAFGFAQDGGRDRHDWLGGFASAAEESLVVEGLEPLQQVFDEAMEDRESDAPFQSARLLAEVLVILKFQRMLQQARPSMQELQVPLLACAHDHYQYLAEIR